MDEVVFVVLRSDYGDVTPVRVFLDKRAAENFVALSTQWADANREAHEAEVERLRPTLDRERDRFTAESDRFLRANGGIAALSPNLREELQAMRARLMPTPYPTTSNPLDKGGTVYSDYYIAEVQLE